MFLAIDCKAPALNGILYAVKNLLNLIMILAPILAIIFLAITFINIARNPDDKKLTPKIRNTLLALAIVFFIPVIVNALMYMIGEKYTLSNCWINATAPNKNVKYIKTHEDKRKPSSVIIEPEEYEKGVPKTLNYDYAGNGTVKTRFSSETMKIVEQHLNDFNYYNFREFMAAHGGVDNYIKSLGGVFTEYYGVQPHVTTEYEFQKVAEYVFGLMYIWGFDYYNGNGKNGHYCKWGGGCYYIHRPGSYASATPDAFYPGQMRHTNEGLSDHEHFDAIVTAKDEMNMTTNCNWTVDMVFTKAGLWDEDKGCKWVSGCSGGTIDLKDAKVGDLIHFFHSPINKKASSSTWAHTWYHVAFVSEVYDDKVVFYDGGSNSITHNNFKWEAKKTDTKLHGAEYDHWAICRSVNLQ